MSKCSMARALDMASVYIDRRVDSGSRLAITLPHAMHILIVAASAALITKMIKKHKDASLDEERAFVAGLLHDSGRYIVDEKEAGYPHPIAGYDRCIKLHAASVAPICLTHAILDKATVEEYPDYTDEQLKFVNDKMSTLTRSFYDDLIMLVDLHCRGDQVLPIQERLNKNKNFYNIKSQDYCEKYLKLYSQFTQKYDVDIYAVCRFVAEHKASIFRQYMPYCHGWLRYVCGDKTVADEYMSYLKNPQVLDQWRSYLGR